MYDFEKLLEYDFTLFNKEDLIENQKCVCLSCYTIFESRDIHFWVDTVPLHKELENKDETIDYDNIGTAMCPYCGIDTVIGEKQGFEINEDFIKAYMKWEMEDDGI